MFYVHIKTGRTIRQGQFNKLYKRYYTLESTKGNYPTKEEFIEAKGFIKSNINMNF